MTVSIEFVHKTTFDSCIHFLLKHEFRCIGLMSRLVKDEKPIFPQEAGSLFVRLVSRENHIEGILFITGTGIVLHCIAEDCDRKAWTVPLNQFLSSKHFNSIVGSTDDTQWLETLSASVPYRTVDYTLMIFQNQKKSNQLQSRFSNADFELRRAKVTELDSILPLQIGYEKEEVISPGSEVDQKICKANLQNILKNQRIYLITHNDVPVAKAGTNALGMFWDQIGGVYTEPQFRGRGFATALVSKAAEEIHAKGKNAALFVKKENTAARKAYQKCGFVDSKPFRISYF